MRDYILAFFSFFEHCSLKLLKIIFLYFTLVWILEKKIILIIGKAFLLYICIHIRWYNNWFDTWSSSFYHAIINNMLYYRNSFFLYIFRVFRQNFERPWELLIFFLFIILRFAKPPIYNSFCYHLKIVRFFCTTFCCYYMDTFH